MEIKEFIDLFMITYRLERGAKLTYKKYNNIFGEDFYFDFYIKDLTIVEIEKEEENVVIRFWIPNEDMVFINLLNEIYKKDSSDFIKCNVEHSGIEKHSVIKLKKENQSNVEWYNKLVKEKVG